MSTKPSLPDLHLVHPPPAESKPLLPSGVLAMLIFVGTEVMFFAGFISAFSIAKTNEPVWPPPGQPRLPIETTLLNSVALIISGVLLYYAGKRLQQSHKAAHRWMLGAMVLGAAFVVFQGFEWASLIAEGLTLTSSSLGGFFYLIVGAHALHAIAGLLGLVWMYTLLRRETLDGDGMWAGQIFWYFVVGLWPILYWQVYL